MTSHIIFLLRSEPQRYSLTCPIDCKRIVQSRLISATVIRAVFLLWFVAECLTVPQHTLMYQMKVEEAK
jgi:hypothetical protein